MKAKALSLLKAHNKVEHAISTFCWCKLKVYDVESGHIYQINGCLNTESPPNIMMLVIMMSNVKIVEHYCC